MDEDFCCRSGLDGADDRIIVGRAADGDPAAFAVLVRRYTPMMRAYTRRILPSNSDVDDIVQDAFVTAWEELPKLDNPGQVKSWLMRVTSRKAIDRVRTMRLHNERISGELPAPDRLSPSRQAETRAGIEELSQALRALPDQQRECWVLREVGEYTYEEISSELGVPLSTVRGLLARARKEIIVRMEKWR